MDTTHTATEEFLLDLIQPEDVSFMYKAIQVYNEPSWTARVPDGLWKEVQSMKSCKLATYVSPTEYPMKRFMRLGFVFFSVDPDDYDVQKDMVDFWLNPDVVLSWSASRCQFIVWKLPASPHASFASFLLR